MTLSFTHLFIFVLGLWRLSSLVANEDGPFLLFKRIRIVAQQMEADSEFIHKFRLADGLECEWCNSLLMGGPLLVLWWWLGDIVITAMFWLAASSGVIAFKYIIHILDNAAAYLYILKEKEERKQE